MKTLRQPSRCGPPYFLYRYSGISSLEILTHSTLPLHPRLPTLSLEAIAAISLGPWNLAVYFLPATFIIFKQDVLIIYMYIITVFRHTRRGHQIPLQMVMSHHVIAGN